MKLYIAVLDEVPDYIVPTLVAHTVLNAHLFFTSINKEEYTLWLSTSFRKVVLRVNRKEFKKISNLHYTYLGHENTTLNGEKSCAVVLPGTEANVLRFAKMWKPMVSLM